MNVSRRKLLQVLPVAAAVPLAELDAQAPAAGDVELAAAHQSLLLSAQIVRQVPLPMTVEPATRFMPRN